MVGTRELNHPTFVITEKLTKLLGFPAATETFITKFQKEKLSFNFLFSRD